MPSMRTALVNLKLDMIFVIYPDILSFLIADQITAPSYSELRKTESGFLLDSYRVLALGI